MYVLGIFKIIYTTLINHGLLLRQIHSIIYFASGRIDTGYKHNLVRVIALHDGVIYFLYIILILDTGVVYVEYYEALLYSGLLELTVLKTYDLNTRGNAEVLELLGRQTHNPVP